MYDYKVTAVIRKDKGDENVNFTVGYTDGLTHATTLAILRVMNDTCTPEEMIVSLKLELI